MVAHSWEVDLEDDSAEVDREVTCIRREPWHEAGEATEVPVPEVCTSGIACPPRSSVIDTRLPGEMLGMAVIER